MPIKVQMQALLPSGSHPAGSPEQHEYGGLVTHGWVDPGETMGIHSYLNDSNRPDLIVITCNPSDNGGWVNSWPFRDGDEVPDLCAEAEPGKSADHDIVGLVLPSEALTLDITTRAGYTGKLILSHFSAPESGR